MAFIKGIDRNQKIMFPEYVEDYIKEDNPIIVVDEYVDTLDFKIKRPRLLGHCRC